MKQYDGMADEMLAMLYVGGDNRAFDELLARNQQKLYNYILFVVRDPELANDVFQETFVKVITRLQEGRYSDSGKFSFWLSKIAHNVIMDTYRQQKSEHIVEASQDNDLNKLRTQDLMEKNRENEYVNTQIMMDVRHLMTHCLRHNARSSTCATIRICRSRRLPKLQVSASTRH